MINWEDEKENIARLIEEGVTYENIGRKYGCSGANIKKQAKKLGIILKTRRKVNPCETFNRGSGKKCMNCGNPVGTRNSKFCSSECKKEYEYKTLVAEWKNGEITGCDINGDTRKFLRKYFLEKVNYSCERCGFNKNNEYTGLSILQLHHKDGDCYNNSEDNIEVLCPNCHCLTENFGSRNKNSTRVDRRTKYYRESIIPKASAQCY